MKKYIPLLILFFHFNIAGALDQSNAQVTVGIPSILSGDLGVLGQNIVDTAETYSKHYLRHPLKFIYEDAKLSSVDGLRAYQKLINIDKVDLIIGGCSSNGTMAASALINSSKTPTITVVTGGRNIDHAGAYIFRVGNSDTLNGVQEAETFIKSGIKSVALLTEETEYTQDIAAAFREKLKALGGTLVYDQNFPPGTTDFRSIITVIKSKTPQAVLMPTQTGTALGVFVKQWREQEGDKNIPIHTSFVAAPNPEARKVAGDAIKGVGYMDPSYDRENPRLKEFFKLYKEDHGHDPAIPFHSAGVIDSLDLLQAFLDKNPAYDKQKFIDFLLSSVKNYHGLMGTYSFDAEGNSDLGFTPAIIN
jgi:branched-chain amino acid transport system substrate-binding protein